MYSTYEDDVIASMISDLSTIFDNEIDEFDPSNI